MEEKSRYRYYAGTNQLYDNEKGELYAYNLNKNKIISILNQQDKRIKELEEQEKFFFDYRDRCQLEEYQRWADKEITKLNKENQQLKQSQNKKAIEELEGLQVQCQFSITFADYTQEQRLYDYINDRIKELKGEKE